MSTSHTNKPFIKEMGWGLPGGRIDFSCYPTKTVRIISFNEKGEILLGLEKSIPEKNKKRCYDYKKYIKEIVKTLDFLKVRGENISKTKFVNTLREIFGKRWNINNSETKILLTAIKESLEETGLLIHPRILTKIRIKDNHEVIICLAEKNEGKLLKNSNEIKKFRWLSLKEILAGKNIYFRHKCIYLPNALEVLLKENYPFTNKSEVENFLNKIKELQKTPVV